MRNKIFLIWFTACTLCVSFDLAAIDNDKLAPSIEHMRSATIITDFLSRYHYRKFSIDDELSAEMFELYIESLDPSKSYFLASDINQFSRYILNLDDALKLNNLSPAFSIFSVYRQRVQERMQFALEQLESDFDFTIDEQYQLRDKDVNFLLTLEEQNDLWRKRVKNDVLSLRLAKKSPDEIKKTLARRYNSVLKRTQQLDNNDIFQTYINSFTGTIDPHTSYLSPRSYDNFEIRMSLSLEGIGAILKLDGDYTVIDRIVAGGPADLAGQLHAKDKIVAVAQQNDTEFTDVIGWRLDEVVELIRGPKDTLVKLRILPTSRGNDVAPEDIEIVRNKIKLEEQAAKKDIITFAAGKHKVGVITVPTFYMDFNAYQNGDKDYRSTTRDVEKLLAELATEEITSLVLDLRSNGGGSLLEATQLAGLFIDKGPVVQVRDSNGHIEIHRDRKSGISYEGPLVVLVDRFSASASEIVSSALQDYGRAVVVGETTFGKGSVQQLIDLDRLNRKQTSNKLGQLKATIAQYFRVNGESTQHRGVIPDILFESSYDRNKYGERGLDNALPWTKISAIYKPTAYISDKTVNRLAQQHVQRTSHDQKYQALLDLYAMNNDLQNQTSLSLHQSKREHAFAERDKRRKALEEIIGIEQQDEDANTELDIDTENSIPSADKDINKDILLIEAAHISVDLGLLWDAKNQRILADRN